MREGPQVLRSPALLLGEVEVVPRPPSRRRGLRSARVKEVLSRQLHWMVRHVPAPLVKGYVRGATLALGLLGRMPANPLWESCASMATLSRRAGHDLDEAGLYRAFLANAVSALGLVVDLFAKGSDEVAGRTRLPEREVTILRDLGRAGRGAVLAVPHNPTIVPAAIRVSRVADTLLVTRNSASVARTRIVLDLYERMGVKVLMVRDGNPFELSRSCLRALGAGRIVVATLDAIYRKPSAVPVRMFGEEVGHAPWAAKLAARARVPVLATYAHSEGRGIRLQLSEPRVPRSVEDAIEAYLRFLEGCVLEDPASWTLLADKRWRRVLASAAAGSWSPAGAARDGVQRSA